MTVAPRGRNPVGRLARIPRSSWLIAGALLITSGLWLAAKLSAASPGDLSPWQAPVQLTALWAATLAAIALLAVVRANALEPLFGGLDRAVRLHRHLGLAALLLLLHALLLAGQQLALGRPLAEVLVPFSTPAARSTTSWHSMSCCCWACWPMTSACVTSCGWRCTGWLACSCWAARRTRRCNPGPSTASSRCAPRW